MKNVMIASLLVCVAAVAEAQTQQTTSIPLWTISKGVQAVQYKDVKYIAAQPMTGDVALVSSKGIHQQAAAAQEHKPTRITTPGYPAWTISKGVARRQYEKSNAKNE